MKRFLQVARTSLLFVGAVVGAGFATGQEIAVFFGNDGVINLIITALFMGLICFVFLEIGGRNIIKNKVLLFSVRSVVAINSAVVYAGMIAAAESLSVNYFNLAGFSYIFVFVSLLFSVKNIGAIKWLNFAVVPIIIGCVIAVGFGIKTESVENVHILRSCAYGGMNMLFAGALMYNEGKTMDFRERIATAVFCAAFIFILLIFMYKSITGKGGMEMPFVVTAYEKNMGLLVLCSLSLAIITTMASCNYIAYEYLYLLCRDKALSVSLICVIGIVISSAGFISMVEKMYPIVSYMGLFVAICALFVYCRQIFCHRKGANC